jgi:CRP-like cAMP-binding protein
MSVAVRPTLQHFLSRLQQRSRLGPDEQEAILSLGGTPVQFDAHRDIVRPGQPVDHSCLVAKGLVARFDQMADGGRQITAFYLRGDMADLHSVVSPVAGWGLNALSACTVIRVPHAELRELASNFPRIALAFWRDTTLDASILAKWVGNLGRRNAYARVSHLLCEVGMRSEDADLGTRDEFRLDASQEQLADALGLTSVHMNRMLQSLRVDQAIVTDHRVVRVPDWDRLVSIADFDPTYLLRRKGGAGTTAAARPTQSLAPLPLRS